MGFVLTQKHCHCSNIDPTCCRDGWKVCLLLSRFTNEAESNYASAEGELLAVTYWLSKTKYYILGSRKLTICIYHKPLLGILNNCKLDDITNKRLARLKEKTFGWRYNVIHIKGSKLTGPDTLSRIPSNTSKLQLLEANLTMNAHFDGEDDDDDYEGTSISEMLVFLRNDVSLEEGEIINQDNSYDLLLPSSGSCSCISR